MRPRIPPPTSRPNAVRLPVSWGSLWPLWPLWLLPSLPSLRSFCVSLHFVHSVPPEPRFQRSMQQSQATSIWTKAKNRKSPAAKHSKASKHSKSHTFIGVDTSHVWYSYGHNYLQQAWAWLPQITLFHGMVRTLGLPIAAKLLVVRDRLEPPSQPSQGSELFLSRLKSNQKSHDNYEIVSITYVEIFFSWILFFVCS